MITASAQKSFFLFHLMPSWAFDICTALILTGTTCEVQIDGCHSLPCRHGGRCHNSAGGFMCTCLPGFQGRQCEINIDECQEQPCQNGAQCLDGVNE